MLNRCHCLTGLVLAVLVCVLTSTVSADMTVRYAFSGTIYERDARLGEEFDQFIGQTITGSYVIQEISDPNHPDAPEDPDDLPIQLFRMESFQMGDYTGVGDPNHSGWWYIIDDGAQIYNLDDMHFDGNSFGLWRPDDVELYLRDDEGEAFEDTGWLQDFNPISQFDARVIMVVFRMDLSSGYVVGRVRANIDELDIVPETATLSFLAFGSLALLRRGRK